MTIDKQIERLFNAGGTYTEIAALLKLTKGTVAGKCRRMGLVREGSQRAGRFRGKVIISPEEQAEREQDMRDLDMLADVREGHALNDVAKHWGVTRSYISRMLTHARAA